ncbi:uncharacterized protein KZ484_010504 isoform 4-T4 [Pholidichthys leucotaenia]
MSSAHRLRKLVRERLAAAAEEIITEFEHTIFQYEEEIERQRRLLDIRWNPRLKTPSTDFPRQRDCREEEVLPDQQLWNQERNSVLDQQKPEPPPIKQEQEELCTSQEGELMVVKVEADAFIETSVYEENEHSEAEPNSEQALSRNCAASEIKDERGSGHVASGSSKKEQPKPKKKRLKTRIHSNSDNESLTSKPHYENETASPQLHDCEEEVIHQFWNQQRNSSLDQNEPDAAQVDERYINQEEEQLGRKQDTDTFMIAPTDDFRDFLPDHMRIHRDDNQFQDLWIFMINA